MSNHDIQNTTPQMTTRWSWSSSARLLRFAEDTLSRLCVYVRGL